MGPAPHDNHLCKWHTDGDSDSFAKLDSDDYADKYGNADKYGHEYGNSDSDSDGNTSADLYAG